MGMGGKLLRSSIARGIGQGIQDKNKTALELLRMRLAAQLNQETNAHQADLTADADVRREGLTRETNALNVTNAAEAQMDVFEQQNAITRQQDMADYALGNSIDPYEIQRYFPEMSPTDVFRHSRSNQYQMMARDSTAEAQPEFIEEQLSQMRMTTQQLEYNVEALPRMLEQQMDVVDEQLKALEFENGWNEDMSFWTKQEVMKQAKVLQQQIDLNQITLQDAEKAFEKLGYLPSTFVQIAQEKNLSAQSFLYEQQAWSYAAAAEAAGVEWTDADKEVSKMYFAAVDDWNSDLNKGLEHLYAGDAAAASLYLGQGSLDSGDTGEFSIGTKNFNVGIDLWPNLLTSTELNPAWVAAMRDPNNITWKQQIARRMVPGDFNAGMQLLDQFIAKSSQIANQEVGLSAGAVSILNTLPNQAVPILLQRIEESMTVEGGDPSEEDFQLMYKLLRFENVGEVRNAYFQLKGALIAKDLELLGFEQTIARNDDE